MQITPKELKDKLGCGEKIEILDVREGPEREICKLEGLWIPLEDLPARLHELDASKEMVVVCHHGIRSAHAVGFLQNQGFARVQNLTGGIDRWAQEVDPSMQRY